MIQQLKESLWRQFGASIDMLDHALAQCPEEFYQGNKRFFYVAFHGLIFLDYYLTIPPKDFAPVLPFTPTETQERPQDAIDDLVPDKFYSKQELLEYVHLNRAKCQKMIAALSEGKLRERFVEDMEEDAMDYPLLEILLYNMRHVQHHVGQLNLLLRQGTGHAPKWIFRADEAH